MNVQQIKEYNQKALTLLSAFLNLCPDAIGREDVKEIAEGCSVSETYAYAVMLAALCGLEAEGKDREFFKGWILPMLHKLDVAPFLQNPYYTGVKISQLSAGRWRFQRQQIAPYEAFVCGDFETLADGRVLPKIGFFDQLFSFPALLEGDREWMTITPNEVITMAEPIALSRGRVLTYGLGLGYFAYMSARRPQVRAVTVVERDREVIGLFEKHILPQFEHPEKVRLVCADAFEYAKEQMPKDGFDFVFTDLWHDPSDGVEAYLKMKQYEPLLPGAQFTYWIENTLLHYL